MNNFPFTKQDIINSVKEYRNANVDIRSCNSGCGSNAKHLYFYVTIGGVEYSDNGKYETAYDFAKAVQKQFREIEKELESENIVFVRDTAYLESGWDYVWRCVKTADLECVVKIVKITACKSFNELQKWLKEKADFELKVTDLYSCTICSKRDSKSYSDFDYTAENEYMCGKILERVKADYKKGNKVSVKIAETENLDNDENRYEYEQYGWRYNDLLITFDTPSGRNKRTIKY